MLKKIKVFIPFLSIVVASFNGLSFHHIQKKVDTTCRNELEIYIRSLGDENQSDEIKNFLLNYKFKIESVSVNLDKKIVKVVGVIDPKDLLELLESKGYKALFLVRGPDSIIKLIDHLGNEVRVKEQTINNFK